MFSPPHPGKVVQEAIEALPMSVTALAAHLGVSRVTLSRVLNGHAGITADMSIKLSQAFGQGHPGIWFNLQNDYDFWQASQAERRTVQPLKTAA